MTGSAQGELWEVLPIKLYLNIAAPVFFCTFFCFSFSHLSTDNRNDSWLGLEANKWNSSFSYQGKKYSEGVLYETTFATICVFAIEIIGRKV